MSMESAFEKKVTINGARVIPRTTVRAVKNETSVSVAEMNVWVSFLGISFASKYDLKVGINATETEFSAKSRLKRLGSINAKENASANELVPIRDAFVISRMRPSILDKKVSRERSNPLEKILVCPVFFVFDVIMYNISVLPNLCNAGKIHRGLFFNEKSVVFSKSW